MTNADQEVTSLRRKLRLLVQELLTILVMAVLVVLAVGHLAGGDGTCKVHSGAGEPDRAVAEAPAECGALPEASRSWTKRKEVPQDFIEAVRSGELTHGFFSAEQETAGDYDGVGLPFGP